MSSKREVPDAITVIHSRKSVRDYTGQNIGKEILDKIMRRGMGANLHS